MASPEQFEEKGQASQRAAPHEPLYPSPLPPELADFLRNQQYACLTHPTDQGTVLVVKVPGHEIESVVGSVPIEFRHQLHEHPSAPVIRMVTRIYDQPDRPLALETFINVQDPEQRSDYEALATQDPLYMLFFDEALSHRLTKAVGGMDQAMMMEILSRADALFHAIPEDQFSFETAKAAVMESTTL